MSVMSDAIVASMTAGMDPMNGVVRQYADKMIENMETDIVVKSTGVLDTIQASRAKAVEQKAPVSVLDAYDRLLARASKL